ncbi:hypothetical protein ACXHMN_10175 [Rhizobium sp. LEGMi12c]
MPTMAILTPDASLFPRLSIVKIDSRTMFAVVGLIGKIMTTDAHILAESHFAGRGRRKRRSENHKTKRKPCKQYPNGNKATRFHKAIPPGFG